MSELLQGAFDLHVHPGPDVVPRAQDAFSLAADAARCGMAGMVLKDHTGCTATLAAALQAAFPDGPRFYSSLTLNPPVGGLNPYAVEAALQLDAAVVFFPTYAARHQIETLGARAFAPAFPRPAVDFTGLSIFSPDGKIQSEVIEIIDLIAASDAALATGHLSPRESFALLALAGQRGVKRMVVTHASEPVPAMTVAEQKEAVRLGAWIEHSVMAVTDCCPRKIVWGDFSAQIRSVGPDRVVLSSDFGQPGNGPPVAAFGRALETLHASRFSEAEIRLMTRENPQRLLEGPHKKISRTEHP